MIRTENPRRTAAVNADLMKRLNIKTIKKKMILIFYQKRKFIQLFFNTLSIGVCQRYF